MGRGFPGAVTQLFKGCERGLVGGLGVRQTVQVQQFARPPALNVRGSRYLASLAQKSESDFVLLDGFGVRVSPGSIVACLYGIASGALGVATLEEMPCQISGFCRLLGSHTFNMLAQAQVKPSPTVSRESFVQRLVDQGMDKGVPFPLAPAALLDQARLERGV
jgi:hypothetical protein